GGTAPHSIRGAVTVPGRLRNEARLTRSVSRPPDGETGVARCQVTSLGSSPAVMSASAEGPPKASKNVSPVKWLPRQELLMTSDLDLVGHEFCLIRPVSIEPEEVVRESRLFVRS